MKEFLKSKYFIYGLFVVVTLIQLGHIMYTFQVKKESLNSDEIWSYFYANSYDQSTLYSGPDNNKDGVVENLEEWVSSENFRDALVVNKGEEFAYDAVFKNHLNDLSPPLHSMVLHTICSFFPETYSWWYGFSINIISFIITMFFLFRAMCLFRNRNIAFLVCSFYGFTQNCIDNFIYLRPYALCTAFFMIILYQTMKILTSKEKVNLFSYICIGIVAFLGFMTHYYFTVAVGIMTFCVCIYLFFKKDYKKMLTYGFTMLGALLLFFLAFSAAVNNINSYVNRVSNATEEKANFNFRIRFILVMNTMLNTVTYFGIPLYNSGFLRILLGIIGFLVIVMMPLLYLFRDTQLIKCVFKTVKNVICNPTYYIRQLIRKLPWIYILIAMMLIIFSIIVAETSYVAGMGDGERRYTFLMTPVMVSFLVCILNSILNFFIKEKKKLTNILLYSTVSFFLALNFIVYYFDLDPFFYFVRESNPICMEEAVKESSIIYVENSNWLVYAISERFLESEEYFQVSRKKYSEYQDEYEEKINENKPVVLVIDVAFLDTHLENLITESTVMNYEEIKDDNDELIEEYNDLISFFESLVPDTEMKLLTKENVFDRTMEVYLVNP